MKIFELIMLYITLVMCTNYLDENKYYHKLLYYIFISNFAIMCVYDFIKISSFFILTIVLYLIYLFFNLLYSKKEKIIINGKLNFNIFNKEYTFKKLISDLKKNNIKHIDEISEAYIKNNKLIISNKPFIFIENGVIDYDTLSVIGKDSIWLTYFISKNKLKLDNIRLAFYVNGTTYFVKNI